MLIPQMHPLTTASVQIIESVDTSQIMSQPSKLVPQQSYYEFQEEEKKESDRDLTLAEAAHILLLEMGTVR